VGEEVAKERVADAEGALVLQQHTILTLVITLPLSRALPRVRDVGSYEDTKYRDVRTNIPLARTEYRSSMIVHPGFSSGSFSFLAPRGTATTCSDNGFDRSRSADTRRVSLFLSISHTAPDSLSFSRRNRLSLSLSLSFSLLILSD